MKDMHYDLIVIGGGTAGALCAIAAARNGARTAVIERNCVLGGMATSAGLTEMNAASFRGESLYHGIEKELFDELISEGHAEYHLSVPMSSDDRIRVDRLRYDPEILKLLLEKKAVDAGVELLYGCELDAASEQSNRCEVRIRTGHGQFTLSASLLADATGNAELVQMLGASTIKTASEDQLVSTLMFRLSRIDLPVLRSFLASGSLNDIIDKGLKKGILHGRLLAFTPIPGSDDVSLNVTRAKGDYEDAFAFSHALIDARSQILPILGFVRTNVPGVQNAYISNISNHMGIRDGRRIESVYELKFDDLNRMKVFEDSIACGCYPMDFHDPVTNTVIWKMLPGVYHIPFRSLIPRHLERTVAVGKCLGAEKQAFSAIRVMPIMMNVGESAGCILANLAKNSSRPKDISAKCIQTFLTAHYDNENYAEKNSVLGKNVQGGTV